MYFRRLTFAVLTVLATFGALITTPAGAIEAWELDETECVANGYTWTPEEGCYDPTWDPESECFEYGGVWNGEWCEYPEWDPEADCAETGGFWNGEWCDYDDGSLESATNEADCLARGGAWQQEEGWGYCYEDDGSIWSARDEGTCLARGGDLAVSYTHLTLPTTPYE